MVVNRFADSINMVINEEVFVECHIERSFKEIWPPASMAALFYFCIYYGTAH